MRRLPDQLATSDRREWPLSPSVVVERELTGPIDLCDARDRPNPATVGFSRRRVSRANLRRSWPRKKR